MKRFTAPSIAPALALSLGLSLSPQSAVAQTNELPVNAAEVEAATRYALPHFFRGYVTGCKSDLASDGYIMTSNEELTQKFETGADAYWPEARNALVRIASEESETDGEGVGDLLASLPDENLKPFVDGILSSLVSGEMKPELCGDIERALKIFDPMPAENYGQLGAFVFEMIERDDARRKARREARREAGSANIVAIEPAEAPINDD